LGSIPKARIAARWLFMKLMLAAVKMEPDRALMASEGIRV
jgi:hypothetical protein